MVIVSLREQPMGPDFRVEALSAGFVFGAIAPKVLAGLAARYAHEAHIEVRHWAMWVFENGCSVPVPTQIDSSTFPAIRACQLLRQTLEEVARVEMHWMGETDRFNIRAVISQLNDVCALGAV